MTDSLDAAYFDGIFADDDDPWSLASSDYERAKFDATLDAIDDRRHARALEIGCAHGVLTARLARVCDTILAVDISARAVELARRRCTGLAGVRVERMAFPGEIPAGRYDLVMLSEVVYYWSDADIAAAASALRIVAEPGARIVLVHWIRETDYPQTGDAAVEKLRAELGDSVTVARADRTDDYRLDVWTVAA